jgi:hypothetical protein
MRRALAAALALFVLALACNALVGLREPIPAPTDAAEPEAGVPDAEVCVDAGADAITGVGDFVSALFAAACARMVRCAMIAPSDVPDCLTAVEYAQRSLYAPSDPIAPGALVRAEQNDLVALDTCGARDCLEAIRTSGCDLTSTFVLSGRVIPAPSAGVPQFDAFKRMSALSGPACARAFVGRSPVGGYCDDARECVPGATCASCTQGSCSGHAVTGPGTCAPVCGPGEPCPFDRICPNYHDCDGGPICACRPPGRAGDPCNDHFPEFQTCADGLLCGPNGACIEIGKSGEGSACSPGLDITCAAGLYCDPTPNACAKRLLARAPCKSVNACDDGLFCVGLGGATAGTCLAPSVDAGACDSGPATTLGGDGCLAIVEHCDGARCVRYPTDTVPQSNLCSPIPASICCTCPDNPCPCKRVKGSGGSCTVNQECLSNDCVSSASPPPATGVCK